MEDKKSWTVYLIVDTRTNEIIYVGQTQDFTKRKYLHFQQKKGPADLYMLEEGRENFSMTPYKEDIPTKEEAVSLEDELICTIHPIMNIRRSGFIEKADPTKYYKDLYISKREQRLAYQNEYYAKNREQVRAYQREYRLRKKLEKSDTVVLF